MAQTIKLKRSATQGATPTTSQLALGEVAINTYDGKMYIKKDVGGTESIVEISGSGGGGSSADAIFEEYLYTATNSQTAFTGNDDNSVSLSYVSDAIQVFLNGILLDPETDYTATNGTTVTLASAAATGDYLQIFAFKQKISDGNVTVDTFSGNNSTTAYTLSLDPGDENNTRVFIDGVYQSKSNYSVSGTTLTFSSAPPSGTGIEVEIGNRNVTLDTASNLDLPDNVKLRLGTSQDLEIYHDGSNSYVADKGTGNLRLEGTNIALNNQASNKTYLLATDGGSVQLRHNDATKIETTSTGVDVTGNIVVSGTVDGRDVASDGAAAVAALPKAGGAMTGAITTNSTFDGRDVATDGTKLDTIETNATADQTQSEINALGITATGLSGTPAISVANITTTGELRGPASLVIDPAGIGDNTGTVVIKGNLQVDGSQTTINSTTVSVDDLNLTLASGAANGTAANGAGITIDGASATLTYNSTLDQWTTNKGLQVAGRVEAETAFRAYDADNTTYRNVLRFDSGDVRLETGTGSSLVDLGIWAGGSKAIAVKAAGGIDIIGNLDVTGTATMDGLTVNSAGVDQVALFESTDQFADIALKDSGGTSYIRQTNGSLLLQADRGNASTNSIVQISVDNSQVARFSAGGDVSFYEDTGTNAKFFWDASAESLGIGTSSPALSSKLNVSSTTTILDSGGTIFASVTDSVAADKGGQVMMGGYYTGTTTAAFGGLAAKKENATDGNFAAYLQFLTSTHGSGNTEKMRIDANGNVGIGTSTGLGNGRLNVESNSTSVLQARANTAGSVDGDTTVVVSRAVNKTAGKWAHAIYRGYSHAWSYGGSASTNEAMRIDSSGNLLVGKTSNTLSLAGAKLGTGGSNFTRSSNEVVYFNRTTDDGTIATFAKDGTTVGSISARSGDLLIGTTDVGLRFDDNASAYIPFNVTTSLGRDAGIDLGHSSVRYKDLYLSGTIYSGAITSSGSVTATTINNATGTVLNLGNSTYTIINNPENSAALYLGDSADRSNYYQNNVHHFRHTNATTYYLSLDATGANIRSGGLQISGTSVIDSSRNLTNIGTVSSTAFTTSLPAGAGTNSYNLNVGGTATTWGSSNRATLHLDGATSALLGFRHGNANRGYLFSTGSTMEFLSYGAVHLLSNASGSYFGKLSSGIWNVSHGYQVAGTTVIDSSRNLANIGTISSSGDITTTADLYLNGGRAIFGTDTGTQPFQLNRIGVGTTHTQRLRMWVDDSYAVYESEQDETNRYGGHMFRSKHGSTAYTRLQVSSGSTSEVLMYNNTGSATWQWNGDNGRQGINKTGPAYTLDVNGTINGSDLRIGGTSVIDSSRNLTNIGNILATGKHYFVSANNYIEADQNTATRLRFYLNSAKQAELIRVSGASGQFAVDQYSTGDTAAGYPAFTEMADTNTGLFFPGTNQVGLSANGTEAVRVSSSGHFLVGKTAIGVASTGLELRKNGLLAATRSGSNVAVFRRLTNNGSIIDFQKDSNAVGSIDSVGGADIKVVLSGDADQYITGNSAANYMSFSAANQERMRIDSDGNVGIGRSSPNAKLDINAGTTKGVEIALGTSGVPFINFLYGTTTVGSITTTGSATAYNTSSDQRLKENIADAPSASDDIDAIQVRSFDWKADGPHQKYGMVAQELLEVTPDVVYQPENEEDMMGVDYSKLVPMLVKEIQSLRARVAQLEQ